MIVNPAHNVRLGRYNLKLLLIVDDVAVRCGAQPFAVCLPPFDNITHLARGIRNRHFVNQKLELDFHQVIIVWKVNSVPDGDNADTSVAQIIQFHQSAAVAAGESGKVLDDEDVILVAHQAAAHLLIALALLKCVA